MRCAAEPVPAGIGTAKQQKPSAKRKAAAALEAASGGEPAPKERGERWRPMAAAARHSTNRLPALLSKTGSGAQLEATSQSAASPKNPFAWSESMDDSEGMGLLDDLCADDGEVPGPVAAADEPTATNSGRQRESSSPQHACLEAVKSRRGGDDAAGGAAKRQRSVCPHNRKRSTCKECGGSSICPHQRQRSRCKDCGGTSICQHNHIRGQCKEED